jgi:hypothetical protein
LQPIPRPPAIDRDLLRRIIEQGKRSIAEHKPLIQAVLPRRRIL